MFKLQITFSILPGHKSLFRTKKNLTMKKTLPLAAVLMGAIMLLSGFMAGDTSKIKMSKKVDAIIQAKCYGCHSNEGKSDKVKEKLNWDVLSTLPADQQLEKMKHIQGTLEEGSMPPKQFVEKMPEKKLTDKEADTLKKWAAKTIKKLS